MKRIITLYFLFLAISLNWLGAQQVSDVVYKSISKTDFSKSDSLEGWEKGGTFAVNFGQVALSNWQGGGQSSVSGNSLLSLFANYKKDKKAWDNSLDLAYGLISQDKGPWIKSDDRIEFKVWTAIQRKQKTILRRFTKL